jgi:hypothetical protein
MLKASRDLTTYKKAKQKNLQKSRFLDFKFIIFEFIFFKFPLIPSLSPLAWGEGDRPSYPFATQDG